MPPTTVCAKTPCCRLTERNGMGRSIFPLNKNLLFVQDPFLIRLWSMRISVCFESVLIYFRVMQSALIRGSLTYFFGSCSFQLSRSTALLVMASTLNCTQLLDYTWAGVRCYLKFVTDTCVVLTENFIVTCIVHAYVKCKTERTVHGSFSVRVCST